MKIFTIGKLKSNFSKVIELLMQGEKITIEYGKKHEKFAVIIPYKEYNKKKRKVGILERKASYKIIGDFKITDEELMSH